MPKKGRGDPAPPKKISFFKRTKGKLFGSIAGPSIAIAESHVLQFDLPIKETITNHEDGKVFVLLNAIMMTSLLNPIITFHNFTSYYRAAVEAGKQGGLAAEIDMNAHNS